MLEDFYKEKQKSDQAKINEENIQEYKKTIEKLNLYVEDMEK